MYKNPINAYKSNFQEISLDEQSKRIIAKAKKYGVNIFENPTLACNLLNPNTANIENSQEIISLLEWMLESEENTQMSK